MQLRRASHASTSARTVDPEVAAVRSRLQAVRAAHETCTERAVECRSHIIWATNSAVRSLPATEARVLLSEHAPAVNELLAQRSAGHVAFVFVAGRRLHVSTGGRFH